MQTARARWDQCGRYWQTRSPFRQRHLLFKGVVQGATRSVLESTRRSRSTSRGRLPLQDTARSTNKKVKSFGESCRTQLFGEGSVWSQRFYEIRYGKVTWTSRTCEKSEEHDVVLTGLMRQFAFEVQSTLRTTLRRSTRIRGFVNSSRTCCRISFWNLWRSYTNRKIVKVSESADDAENSFICHLLTLSGHRCILILATWRGLTSLQTSGRHLASLLTVTITCFL